MIQVDYSEGLRNRLVQRMAGPEGISANALSKEVGISQPSLSRWLREAGRISGMSKSPKQEKSPHRWSAEERWRVILESSSLSDDELGAFLRRKGLHVSQLEEWRKSAMESLAVQKSKRRVMSKEMKIIRELEKELRRKDKVLAEVTALLVLKKKIEAIWGAEDDDTPTKRET